MLFYFCVRKWGAGPSPQSEGWYDVRTKDWWSSMIHEEETSVDEGVFACCAWSATQQGADEGPVWPIAHAFTSLSGAQSEINRSILNEPTGDKGGTVVIFQYGIVEVRVDFVEVFK